MSNRLYITETIEGAAGFQRRHRKHAGCWRLHPSAPPSVVQQDPKNFRMFTLDGENIVWDCSRDLIFPIEQLHEGEIRDNLNLYNFKP